MVEITTRPARFNTTCCKSGLELGISRLHCSLGPKFPHSIWSRQRSSQSSEKHSSWFRCPFASARVNSKDGQWNAR